ncbi:MAG: hypothetical protein ACK5MA_06450 [Parachlamydiaceae bacterium]
MVNAMDNKSSLEIKKSFLEDGTIPEEARTVEVLTQCLIINKELRKNIPFLKECVKVDPSLISFASKRIKAEIVFEEAPHLKIPSPSVQKKTIEAKMVQAFRTKHHP